MQQISCSPSDCGMCGEATQGAALGYVYQSPSGSNNRSYFYRNPSGSNKNNYFYQNPSSNKNNYFYQNPLGSN